MRYKTIIKICRATTFPTFAVYGTAFVLGKEWVTPMQVMIVALSIQAVAAVVESTAAYKESKRLSKLTFDEMLEEQENEK